MERKTTRRTRWIGRAAGALFGLGMAWIMIEALLRVGFDALPPGTQGTIENVRVVPWSDRTIVPVPPWFADIDYQNIVPPGLDEHPIYFSDGHFTVSTIELWDARVGLRSSPPQWPVELMVVGDSFAFCFNDFDACWVQRLHLDHGWSVMNLGQRGTGTLAHLEMLRDFGPYMEPQVVIWQWYGNDANEDYGLALMQGKTGPLEVAPPVAPGPDYGWLADYSAVYAIIRDQIESRDRSPSPDFGKMVTVNGQELRLGDAYNLYAYDLSRAANQYGWELMAQALDEAQRVAQDDIGAALVIVLMPTKEEVYAAWTDAAVGPDYVATVREGRDRLLALCAERGWHCLDLTPALQAEAEAGREIFYSVDHHITDNGNRVVADTVAQYLTDEGILTARK